MDLVRLCTKMRFSIDVQIPGETRRRFTVDHIGSQAMKICSIKSTHIDRRKSKAIDVIQMILLKLQTSRTRAKMYERGDVISE